MSRSDESGNNTNLGAFGFANNIGLIGSAATGSGNNSNTSGFGGFAQNTALIGSGADGSGNNEGIFNFALVGPGVDDAGNNDGRLQCRDLPRRGTELRRAGLLQLLRSAIRSAVRKLTRLYR